MSEEQTENLHLDEYDIDIDVLITLIEERPVIWDKTLESYKSRTETNNAWREICHRLNPKFEELGEVEKNKYGKELMKKWTNIRDRQNKYLKKLQEQGKTGSGAKNAKKYIYSEQLSFLKKTASHNSTVSSCDDSEERESHCDDMPNSDGPGKSSDGPTPRKKSKPQQKYTDVEKAIINKLSVTENRHMNFFKGIIPSLDLLSDEEVIRFQSGVLHVLQDIHNCRRLTSNNWNVQVPPPPPGYAPALGNFNQQPFPAPGGNRFLHQQHSSAPEIYQQQNSSGSETYVSRTSVASDNSPIMDINFADL